MDNEGFSFEKLRVYNDARRLVKCVYVLQNKFPQEEKYALGDQIRRAASSVTANIAEGCGRISMKEKIHFIGIAYGSLLETFSELQTAQDLNYISEDDINEIRPQFYGVAKMLSGLRSSYQDKLQSQEPDSSSLNAKHSAKL